MYDLIVVGMGGAGCMACSVLQHFDKRILALEAMERLGGRVHTAPLGDGIVELGAEWIHGTKNNSVYDYAITENIELMQQGVLHKVFTSDGLDGNAHLLMDLVEYAFNMMEQPPDVAEPMGQYVTRRLENYAKAKHPELEHDTSFMESFLRWMNLVVGTHESCAHWDDVSTQTQYEELEGPLHMSWHKYGYKTLFDLILGYHKTGLSAMEIKLNTEVVNIKLPTDSDDPVQVTCKDGTIHLSVAVIVTLSLGVLKERHASLFSPPLPEKKVKAIDNLSIGVVDKIVLLFEEIWWPTDVICFAFLWRAQDLATVPEEDKWTTMVFGASISMANEKCLVFWTSGDEAKLVETLSDDVVKSKLMGLLRKFMAKNHVIPEPIDMVRSGWYSNPYSRGSYSFDNVYTPDHPEVRADLAEPIYDQKGKLRLMFAGEATSKSHFSTVHGAIESGRREAHRFLKTDFNFVPTEAEE